MATAADRHADSCCAEPFPVTIHGPGWTGDAREQRRGQGMIRKSFIIRLKPGALEEYVREHNKMWPELVEEIRASGIKNITMVADDPLLYIYSEVEAEDAWDRLWHSDVHMRWGQAMSPYLVFRDDGIVDSRPLREVFHLDA